MQIVEVWGVPDNVSRVTLAKLSDQIIEVVTFEMGCRPESVRVFYPKDMLTQGGYENVFVYLKTAMFEGGEGDNAIAITATIELAKIVCAALETHDVECFTESLPKDSHYDVRVKRS